MLLPMLLLLVASRPLQASRWSACPLRRPPENTPNSILAARRNDTADNS